MEDFDLMDLIYELQNVELTSSDESQTTTLSNVFWETISDLLNSLQLDNQIQKSDEGYECKLCEKSFGTLTSLAEHCYTTHRRYLSNSIRNISRLTGEIKPKWIDALGRTRYNLVGFEGTHFLHVNINDAALLVSFCRLSLIQLIDIGISHSVRMLLPGPVPVSLSSSRRGLIDIGFSQYYDITPNEQIQNAQKILSYLTSKKRMVVRIVNVLNSLFNEELLNGLEESGLHWGYYSSISDSGMGLSNYTFVIFSDNDFSKTLVKMVLAKTQEFMKEMMAYQCEICGCHLHEEEQIPCRRLQSGNHKYFPMSQLSFFFMQEGPGN